MREHISRLEDLKSPGAVPQAVACTVAAAWGQLPHRLYWVKGALQKIRSRPDCRRALTKCL